jgi:cysteine synthase A
LLATQPGAWCPDQYDNPDNVAAYVSLADELAAQLGRIDILVCSVGTGGHSAGIFRVLQRYFPHLRLIGVDTIGSTIFGQPATSRLMRGLGSSIHPGNVDYDAFDEVHWVAPHVPSPRGDASRHRRLECRRGGAMAVARTHDPDVRVAAVFPDGPQRYFDTIYNDKYCAHHALMNTAPPADPDLICSTGERVVQHWTRCGTVTDPAAVATAPKPRGPQR